MHKRLSFSRFSLNTILRRHNHKRTNSLPESALLTSPHELLENHRSTIGDEPIVSTSNEEAPVSSSARRKQPEGAVKLERYNNELGLPKNEKVLKVYPCFMVSDLLIQGCLIITEGHLCFCSNIFGLKRNRKIRFEDIVQVTKEKVYALFPTGIGVRTDSEKVTFSSATSRDKLIRLLLEQSRRASSRQAGRAAQAAVDRCNDVATTAARVHLPDFPSADSISTTDLLASDEVDDSDGAVVSETNRRPQQQQQQKQHLTESLQHSVARPQVLPTPEAAAGRDRASSSKSPSPSADGRTADLRQPDGPYSGPALSCIAIALAVCALAAALLAWRLSRMQQEMVQLTGATSARQSGYSPSAADTGNVMGSANTDLMDLEISGLINAVSNLHKKLLHMRQLLLQLLLSTSHAANSTSGHRLAA